MTPPMAAFRTAFLALPRSQRLEFALSYPRLGMSPDEQAYADVHVAIAGVAQAEWEVVVEYARRGLSGVEPETDPWTVWVARRNLGLALARMGQRFDALVNLLWCKEHQGVIPQAAGDLEYCLAQVYRGAGDYEAALDCLRRALAFPQPHPLEGRAFRFNCHCEMVIICHEAEDRYGMRAVVSQMTEMIAEDAQPSELVLLDRARAWLALREGQWHDALLYCGRVFQARPESMRYLADCLAITAFSWQQLGDSALAQSAAEQALELAGRSRNTEAGQLANVVLLNLEVSAG